MNYELLITLNLPSFLWLWRIAAWSMGLSLTAYLILAVTGIGMWRRRTEKKPRPPWLKPLHYVIGGLMVFLVLLLLCVGLIGTLGYYGSLGHSPHLIAGIIVVLTVLISGISGTQIHPKRPWARSLHIRTNIILFLGFLLVTLTGWEVVQKYLP